MNFRETLNKFNEAGLYLYKVVAATEVDNYCVNNGIELDDTQFDIVSRYVYDWIIDTDCPAWKVVQYLMKGLGDCYYTIDDIAVDEDIVREYINSRF